MEIADVFCVNKADKPEAGAMVRALRAMLHLRAPSAWYPLVVKTSALEDEGIEGLVSALDAHRAALEAEWDAIRADRLRRRVRRIVESRWRRDFWDARSADLEAAVLALEDEDARAVPTVRASARGREA